jgi:hypothetical protein
MRGGADLGHPQQMFVEAAEMLAEHNSGSDPIRKYKDKEGKVRYTTSSGPESEAPTTAPQQVESKKERAARPVREYIVSKGFVTMPELRSWRVGASGAPSRDDLRDVAMWLCEDGQEPKIFTSKVQLSPNGGVPAQAFSVGKSPWEYGEEIMKRRTY